jgi:inosine/xanthosine triphosphatase
MKTIIVASENPAKIKAVEEGFKRMFPDMPITIQGVKVSSGVSDQPMSDEETLLGAEERARAAKLLKPDADFWVGLEGGISMRGNDMETGAWIVVQGKDGLKGRGKTGSLLLPEAVRTLVEQGYELGKADDMVFGTSNSKHDLGSVGLMTNGVISRSEFYADAVILALIPWCHPSLYTTHS